MTAAEILRTCEGIAEAMLINLDTGFTIDNTMLMHAVRDLANLCAEQQRQINRLIEVHGT